MNAPSKTPEAAGLEVVAWRVVDYEGRERGLFYSDDVARETTASDDTIMPLVTAASAQAAIDAEKARADRLAKALMTARDYVSDAAEGHAWTASQVAELMRGNRPDNRQAGDDLASIDAALQQETQP